MTQKYKKRSRHRTPDEKRLRKVIRALIREYKLQRISEDDLVRALFEMADDERRRAYMSVPPEIYPTPKSFRVLDEYLTQKKLIQSLSSF